MSIKGLLILIPFTFLILLLRRKMSSSTTGNTIKRIGDLYTLIKFIPFVIILFIILYIYLYSLFNKKNKDKDNN